MVDNSPNLTHKLLFAELGLFVVDLGSLEGLRHHALIEWEELVDLFYGLEECLIELSSFEGDCTFMTVLVKDSQRQLE